MSGYKNFAVAGAGTMGSLIVEELLKEKAAGHVGKVVVLSRSATANETLTEKGAEPIMVDYTSPSSLESALKGMDVVISTLGGFALAIQEPLGVAAKAAGVKLFVPSEFGADMRGATDGFYAAKSALFDKLQSIGLPTALFFNGPFSDWVWYQPFIGTDLKNGKIELAGSGDALGSLTSRRDVARYTVHVLLNLPATKLHNSVHKIEGERTSFNRVLEQYQARTGKKLEITHIPMEQVQAAAAKGDIKSFVQLLNEVYGLVGTKEEVNADWPEFNPETALDAMLSYE